MDEVAILAWRAGTFQYATNIAESMLGSGVPLGGGNGSRPSTFEN